MLNYAAAQFYAFMIRVPLIDPNEKTGTPMSARLPESTVLNKLFKGAAVHQGIFLALILALLVYLLLLLSSISRINKCQPLHLLQKAKAGEKCMP